MARTDSTKSSVCASDLMFCAMNSTGTNASNHSRGLCLISFSNGFITTSDAINGAALMSACRHNTCIARGLPAGSDLGQNRSRAGSRHPVERAADQLPEAGTHEALTAERTRIRAFNTDTDA